MSVDSDTFNNYHTYEIDWTPESIKWSIDGEELRTVNKADTWNSTKNRFDYPQTPARVQLSLWPAGLSSNGEGTIEWAGGLIDWNSPDIQNANYYYAVVREVKIECYDPPDGAKKSGSKAYIYNNKSGLNNTIEITDENTILKSFLGSGLQPDAGAQASGTASASEAVASTDAPTVPGLTGAGTGSNGQRGAGDSPDGGSPTPGSEGGSPTDGAAAPSGSDFHGFSQGNGNTGSASHPKGEKVMQGSILAVLLAIAGLLIV